MLRELKNQLSSKITHGPVETVCSPSQLHHSPFSSHSPSLPSISPSLALTALQEKKSSHKPYQKAVDGPPLSPQPGSARININLETSTGDSSCRPKIKQVPIEVHLHTNPVLKPISPDTATEPQHDKIVVSNVSV